MLPNISHRLSAALPTLSTKFAMPVISFGEVREGAPIINQRCNKFAPPLSHVLGLRK
jgi:hypothetical protein